MHRMSAIEILVASPQNVNLNIYFPFFFDILYNTDPAFGFYSFTFKPESERITLTIFALEFLGTQHIEKKNKTIEQESYFFTFFVWLKD